MLELVLLQATIQEPSLFTFNFYIACLFVVVQVALVLIGRSFLLNLIIGFVGIGLGASGLASWTEFGMPYLVYVFWILLSFCNLLVAWKAHGVYD